MCELKHLPQQSNLQPVSPFLFCRRRERYRDLIDAADTIVRMASSTAEVMSSVNTMHQLCANLNFGGVCVCGKITLLFDLLLAVSSNAC